MESTLGPYDKIIALTEAMLNNGLSTMFTIYHAELSKFVYTEPGFATINIDLLAPKIIIQADGKAFYQFRIDFGTIESPLLPSQVDVEKWIISHEFDIKVLLDCVPGGNAAGDKAVVSDYAIERLFSVMSATANEGFVIHPTWSECLYKEFPGGVPKSIDWKTWSSMPQTQGFSKIISDTIVREWPKKLNKRSYNSTGLRFQMPGLIPDLGNHLEPYALPESRDTFSYRLSSGQKVGDYDKDREFNSILICNGRSEVTSTKFSDAIFSSNFISEFLPSDGGERLHGLWAVNSQAIFEKHVLPRLTVLLEASEIQHETPTWDDGELEPRYSLCRDFSVNTDGGQPKAAYTFTRRQEVLDDEQRICYVWRKEAPVVKSITKNTEGRPGDTNTYSVRSNTSCSVSWKRTKSAVDVKFVSNHPVISEWKGKREGLHKYTTYIRWHLKLNFEMRGSLLSVKVTDYPREGQEKDKITLEVRDQIAEAYYETYESLHPITFQDFVKQDFMRSVTAIVKKVDLDFQNHMVFDIPETRWFQFYSPAFNSSGDLVAAVLYKTPQYQKIISTAGPLVEEPPKPPTPPPPEPEPQVTTKLTWGYKSEFNKDRTRLVLTVSGKNETKATLVFGFVEAVFKSGKTVQHNLFTAIKFPFPVKGDAITLIAPKSAKMDAPDKVKNLVETWKISINSFKVAPGEMVVFAIDGSSTGLPGNHSIDLLEARKDPENEETYEKEGKYILTVAIE
ncbi:hypothetical protein H072_3883 [Dactylellina haptotyla CBS 200.50]|uniref:Uncharacterized protein n=1 Tax=Dactylellina haptotyla (strain CBS 200.50) TaxID=1284197 RepID=S8C3A9_DACHA|nr:hypothetical protein H072_3883 [Dactylellina haptotyla CBS 200.50]